MILIKKGKIALIERHRSGQHYFILPGGQVEDSESLREALVREAKEELGLDVRAGELVAVVSFHDKPQYYYTVEVTGGEFGNGNGPEMLGLYPPENGSYEAIWMPVKKLRHIDLRPSPLIKLIEEAETGAWPQQPLYLYEEDHNE